MSAARPAACAVLGVVVLLVLAACGGGGGSGAQSGGTEEAGAGNAAEGGGGAAAGNAGGSGAAAEPAEAEFAERRESDAGASGADLGGLDRRVVRDAELGIVAEDVRGSAVGAQRIAARFGGSVLSSRVYEGDGQTRAEVVLAVPSDRFEEALDELRGLGRRVTTDSVTGEDVTEEFVDLESRERNLLAAEESLLRLYDRAESIEDTLDVGAELTEVRGEIERVQGRLKYLEGRTEFSRISVSIEPVPPAAVAASRPVWEPASVAGTAWAASLTVLQGIATALISVLVFGWWLVPPAAVGLLVWRRRRNGAAPPAP